MYRFDSRVAQWLLHEFLSIRRSSILSNSAGMDLKSNPTATFEIQLPDWQTQPIVVRGLLITAKDWLSPTTQMLPVDVQ